jgi:hypothetical protein
MFLHTEIVNEGAERTMSIGLCGKDYRPDRQPGWDQGSVGYHADDGGYVIPVLWGYSVYHTFGKVNVRYFPPWPVAA